MTRHQVAQHDADQRPGQQERPEGHADLQQPPVPPDAAPGRARAPRTPGSRRTRPTTSSAQPRQPSTKPSSVGEPDVAEAHPGGSDPPQQRRSTRTRPARPIAARTRASTSPLSAAAIAASTDHAGERRPDHHGRQQAGAPVDDRQRDADRDQRQQEEQRPASPIAAPTSAPATAADHRGAPGEARRRRDLGVRSGGRRRPARAPRAAARDPAISAGTSSPPARAHRTAPALQPARLRHVGLIPTGRRASSARSPASRITASGPATPVKSSNWSTAWWTSRSRPLTSTRPVASRRQRAGWARGRRSPRRRRVRRRSGPPGRRPAPPPARSTRRPRRRPTRRLERADLDPGPGRVGGDRGRGPGGPSGVRDQQPHRGRAEVAQRQPGRGSRRPATEHGARGDRAVVPLPDRGDRARVVGVVGEHDGAVLEHQGVGAAGQPGPVGDGCAELRAPGASAAS